MRIGFDLRPAVKKNSAKRGVGRYTLEVFKALLKMGFTENLIAYLIKDSQLRMEVEFRSRNLPFLRKPSRLNWILDWFTLPRQFKKDGLDLFHATDLIVLPKNISTSVWMTVHDLIPFVFWEETIRSVPKDFVFMLEKVWDQLSRVDRIITSSRFSKDDICKRTGLRPERVSVVYLGCAQELCPIPSEEAKRILAHEHGISDPFLFYVGGTDFRKNLPFLLMAFSKIVEDGYQGNLILGGETFKLDIPETRNIFKLGVKLGISERICLPGYISDKELACFFSACDFFVFPSLYEGFGLPVLEALRCGAPVLTSSSTSIPEVAGDCAGYFDPENEDELVKVFWEAYEDKPMTEEKRQMGFKQASRFSWQNTAQGILKLYKDFNAGDL